MPNLLHMWRARRERQRLAEEAQHLIREARRILKKKSYRIPDAVAVEVNAAVTGVETALQGRVIEPIQQALKTLDERMEQHLAFARKSTVREYSESIFVAVGIALFLRAFVVEAFQIPSGSMIPTLEVGDHIFVSKFAYGVGIPFTNTKVMQFATPKRGDVVVFKYPLQQDTDYIKRVVGLPGETVEVRRNEVFVNGKPMARELAGPTRYSEGPRYEGQALEREAELWVEHLDGEAHKVIQEPGRSPSDMPPKEIPPGNVFVMGDNRDNSNDSRVWGTVPLELVKGRALIVWWSRGPTRGEWSWDGFVEWAKAIRWRRFFSVVE